MRRQQEVEQFVNITNKVNNKGIFEQTDSFETVSSKAASKLK